MSSLRVLLVLLILTIPDQPAFPQSDELKALRQEIDALKEEQRALRKDLQELANSLRERGGPTTRDGRDLTIGVAQLPLHAQALGLNPQPFGQCLDGGKYAAEIRKDLEDGQKAGVRGTPTFFLGLTDAKTGQLRPVKMIVGSQPYTSFKEAIET